MMQLEDAGSVTFLPVLRQQTIRASVWAVGLFCARGLAESSESLVPFASIDHGSSGTRA
jgi:hypothetical protein